MSKSKELFARARAVLPGGVSSPVRAFNAVGGVPPVIRSAHGAQVVDEDGRTYLDFVGSWGPLILGHAHDEVLAAIQAAGRHGTTYGAPCRAEIELAEMIVKSYPNIDQVRFVSSGTEAVMSAVRLARGATGRDLVVKFSGCYHGHSDALLVSAGSGLATLGVPDSAGVTRGSTSDTRVLELDDDDALRRLFAAEGKNIAAVIIEPAPANHGLLLQRPAFLATLRRLCDQHHSLLILDEVITGFRLGPGGASERFEIPADLATFGKVVGGGLPVGAFAGRRELMKQLAPEGSVYQAGTLSGNPIAMTAGLATLRILERDNVWHNLEELGAYLEDNVQQALTAAAFPAALCRLGSLFWTAWHSERPPRRPTDISPQAQSTYRTVFHALLRRGVAMAPSAFEVGFLSSAHTRTDIDRFADMLYDTLGSWPQERSVREGHG